MQQSLDIEENKTILFVSDLHIDSSKMELVKKLNRIIEAENPDVIFIVGDLFNASFGWMRPEIYDDFGFLNYLRELIRVGKKVVWVEGNHEFGLKYLRGINTVSKEIILNIGLKKVYLAHGDLIDKANTRYLIFRFLTKNRFSIFMARFIPHRLLYLAAVAIDKNLMPTYNDSSEKMRAFAKELFGDGFDIVILAHTHQADYYKEDNHCYYNIGDFADHNDYLLYKDGKFSAIRYKK